jgi:cobalt-precorrin-7 (C5)-methyltransferase
MTGIVHLVGCGPGGVEWVLPRARAVVASADVVFGSEDLLALFPESPAPRIGLPSRPETAAPLVRASLERGLDCAVLVRGDCGLHSLAKGLQARLPPGSCRRVPGLSSVQVACAAFGLDWERVRILSAHGRELEALSEADRKAPLLAVLGGGEGFSTLLDVLRTGLGIRRIHLASDLTLTGESLCTCDPQEPIPTGLSSRTVALLETISS